MISILLVSHGKMAEGMKDSLELIMGPVDHLDIASLLAGQDIEQFKHDVADKIEKLDEKEGVLVFVDLFGASPYNASQYATLKLAEKGVNIRVITGMNLPMLLEGIMLRESSNLDDLVKSLLHSGRDGIAEPVVFQDVNEDEGDCY